MGISKLKFNRIVSDIYIVAISLSLFLHIFNKAELIPGVKLFYIPVLISALLGSYLFYKKAQLYAFVVVFISFTAISAIVSFSGTAISALINLVLIVLSTYGLRNVEMDRLLKINAYLIPVALIWLFLIYIREPVYRFQGYYNDPNYLSTTLLAFLYMLLLLINRSKSKLLNLLYIIEVFILLLLILFTISRTGIACSLLILIVALLGSIKKHPVIASIIGVVGIVSFSHFFMNVFDEQAYVLEQRLNNDDNLSSAGNLRMELSLQGVEYVLENPFRWVIGLGLGETEREDAIPFRKDFHRDHNTVTSCFTEQGVMAFLFYFLILLKIWISLHRRRDLQKSEKLLRQTFFLVLGLFSLSIWQMTYLPYWWLLFLLDNRKIIYSS